jgi:hypothetical protein
MKNPSKKNPSNRTKRVLSLAALTLSGAFTANMTPEYVKETHEAAAALRAKARAA